MMPPFFTPELPRFALAIQYAGSALALTVCGKKRVSPQEHAIGYWDGI
jgi:hypothetical protein